MMKTKLMVILTPIIILLLIGACKKTPSIKDTKLYGYWQVDSMTSIYGGGTKTQLMDTLFGLKPNSSLHIVMQIGEDGMVSAPAAYHYAIEGDYKLQSSTLINFQIIEIKDLANRPKSDWQPMVVSAFNSAETYRIEGNGYAGSQLLLYYAQGKAIIHCTKL